MLFKVRDLVRAANAPMVDEYQPVIRGYFAVVAGYYAVMATSYFWTLSGRALVVLEVASITACLVASAAWLRIQRPKSVGELEAATSLVNLLMIGNVLVALDVEYSQAKLVYFIMMVMIFAFASVTLRQAVLSISVAFGGLFYELATHTPDQLPIYGYVAFAAALSAIAIAFFLRRIIALAVTAKQFAERRLAAAQRLGERARQQSFSDSLTGLPNRRAFFHALEEAKADDRDHWLILIDLDGFKAVNDNHGHIMGDELLKAVARRMRDYCGSHAQLSRMGGDEFNIILPGPSVEWEVEAWCQGLLQLLAETYLIEDRLIHISASIGCYLLPTGEDDATLIRNADYALLMAKRSGKNQVVNFRDDYVVAAEEHFRIEQALRVADFAEEIELLFQPQFDLMQNRIVSAEALARWNSPELGQIGPYRFIQIAEDCGLISSITIAVLDKALAALKSLEVPFPLSINLSSHDLMSDQIVDKIIERVHASGIAPELIEFEVTETAMMADTGRASNNLYRLTELGHPLSLDDFGTGYSNFSYLRSLPISKLKVDRSFIQDLGDPMAEKVLRSLVGMAKTLNVHCLLEGVENELELLVAKRVGSQSVQGYLVGIPMSMAELQQRIDGGNTLQDSGVTATSIQKRASASGRRKNLQVGRSATRRHA